MLSCWLLAIHFCCPLDCTYFPANVLFFNLFSLFFAKNIYQKYQRKKTKPPNPKAQEINFSPHSSGVTILINGVADIVKMILYVGYY
jgi:hypothetical protein